MMNGAKKCILIMAIITDGLSWSMDSFVEEEILQQTDYLRALTSPQI